MAKIEPVDPKVVLKAWCGENVDPNSWMCKWVEDICAQYNKQVTEVAVMLLDTDWAKPVEFERMAPSDEPMFITTNGTGVPRDDYYQQAAEGWCRSWDDYLAYIDSVEPSLLTSRVNDPFAEPEFELKLPGVWKCCSYGCPNRNPKPSATPLVCYTCGKYMEEV